MRSARPDGIDPVTWQGVHLSEPDHVLSLAYYPKAKRHAAASLMAYAAELRAIPLRVKEIGLAEIRYQWWSDAIETVYSPQAASADHPVLVGLCLHVRPHTAVRQALQAMTEEARAASGDASAVDAGLATILATLCDADEKTAKHIGEVGRLYGGARAATARQQRKGGEDAAQQLAEAIATLAPFDPAQAPVLAALKGGIAIARGQTPSLLRRQATQFMTVLWGR